MSEQINQMPQEWVGPHRHTHGPPERQGSGPGDFLYSGTECSETDQRTAGQAPAPTSQCENCPPRSPATGKPPGNA